MFETHDQPLLSSPKFVKRVILGLAIGLGIDLLAVTLGATGYHLLEGWDWLDAFSSSAMVVTGNSPLKTPDTPGGKVFIMFDALLGALTFISVAGVILSPVFHRLLHSFHIGKELEGE